MIVNPKMTVAAIQCPLGGAREENVMRVEKHVREAAKRGAQIVLPPELFEGTYFCKTQDEARFADARPLQGNATIERMQKLARDLNVVIPVSFFEHAGPAYFNSVAVIDAGGALLGVYRKSHIPDGPGYQEKFYFRPGDTGFKVWSTQHGKIGVGICWDQWFPECARAMTLLGADVLFYPTAIGAEPHEPGLDTRDPWQRAMQGHAICNITTVVAANRIGIEEGQTFYGSSFVANFRGDKIAELDREEEGVIVAQVDVAEQTKKRAAWGFFRDRRTDLYGALVSPLA